MNVRLTHTNFGAVPFRTIPLGSSVNGVLISILLAKEWPIVITCSLKAEDISS